MDVEYRAIGISLLEMNTGQVEGLPSNPRQWTREELDSLKKSLRETPELFQARGCIVAPYGGKFIVLGGNMRLAAATELGDSEVPCMVLPEGLPVSKMKEIVLKDNGSFGSWDMDALANEWDDLPLGEWGVEAAAQWSGAGGHPGSEKDAEEDEFDENTDLIVCRCKPGEIWQCGEHRVMCGDSTDPDAVRDLMGGGES